MDDNTKSFLKINDSFDIPSETIFDYPSFIRQIDFEILHGLICSWLKQNKFSHNSTSQRIDYEGEINRLLSYDYRKHDDGFQISIEILIFFEILFKLIIRKTQLYVAKNLSLRLPA